MGTISSVVFRHENSAGADAIIHGDSLSKKKIFTSDFRFEDPFLHFRGKFFFWSNVTNCNVNLAAVCLVWQMNVGASHLTFSAYRYILLDVEVSYALQCAHFQFYKYKFINF